MRLTDNIKAKIEELYDITPDDVHGVSLGYKLKNGINTGQIGIVFNVIKKLNKNELKPSDILPSTITVDGVDIVTDVIEETQIKLLSCYPNLSATPLESFVGTDANITRLQGYNTPILTPMKGGQELVQFPTGFNSVNVNGETRYGWEAGTLGMFCLDSIDYRVVGVTNSHVAIDRRNIATNRDITLETKDPYNIYDDMTWIVDG